MKKPLFSLFVWFLLFSVAQTRTLRIGIDADLAGNDLQWRIFRAELLLSEGEGQEIFTGPYTVGLNFTEGESREYYFNADLFGLGPR